MGGNNFESLIVQPLWSEAAADHEPRPLAMTASEQMFFCGSPLAHVVHFEEERRVQRQAEARYIRHARRLYV